MNVYTALGDSITFGENATSARHRYVNLLAGELSHREGRTVLEVLAQPGWTSGALTAAALSEFLCPLRQARLVTIWIGGNDLAYAGLRVLRGAPAQTVETALLQYGRHLHTLVAAIKQCSRARIVLCTQYNPFPNSEVACKGVAALNAVTAETARAHGVVLAPTAALIDGRQPQLISGYTNGRIEDVMRSPVLPVHPNNAGHRVLADGLHSIIGRF